MYTIYTFNKENRKNKLQTVWKFLRKNISYETLMDPTIAILRGRARIIDTVITKKY